MSPKVKTPAHTRFTVCLKISCILLSWIGNLKVAMHLGCYEAKWIHMGNALTTVTLWHFLSIFKSGFAKIPHWTQCCHWLPVPVYVNISSKQAVSLGSLLAWYLGPRISCITSKHGLQMRNVSYQESVFASSLRLFSFYLQYTSG